jgi:eukaryotic-like serine/threonine-protein kinase
MAFCHECGSQVAELDVFCPFCGVSLQPVSRGGLETDDPYANTIAIDREELGVGEPETDAAHAEMNAEAGTAGVAEQPSAPDTADDLAFDDIPTPLFIERAGAALEETGQEPETSETTGDDGMPASGEVAAWNGSNDVVEDETSAETPGTGGEIIAETAPADEETASPAAAGEEPIGDGREVSEVASTDTAGTEFQEESVSDAPDDGSEQDVVEVEEDGPLESEANNETFAVADSEVIEGASDEAGPEDCGEEIDEVVLEPETTAAEAPEEDQVPGTKQEEDGADLKDAAKSSGDLYSEIKPFPDQGISMPLEALEPPPADSPSVYDSVRIMDSDPKSIPLPTGGGVTSNPAPAPVLASDQPGTEKASQSYTTPNMGTSDTDGRKSTKLKPLDEGTVLNNRYEIIRKIGGGGMGAVYLASDNNLGGVLRAVKEMVQAHIEEEQQDKAINDFKRESMILSTLDHPSIPTIYDYFFDDKESRFYLVMKYISGGDLASRIRSAPEGRIEEKTITEWAIQVADVLDYLHNRPSTIVYRDLKPSNVMLDGNTGRVMLIDFGIARSINQVEEKGVTAVGTMGYAPPELFSGNVEPRSDIYSLGSTMFHLLTGADPQNNPLLIFDFQKNPRPRQINPQLSDQIERILMHSVEYNATSRFNSAAELKQVLEEHLDNLKTGRVTYGIKEIPASIGLANQPVFCGFCGQKIVATDMFCAFCGAKQPLAQQGVHAEIYARSAPTARLMVIGTNELDTPAFTLEKDESLVGRRDPMSNIFPEVDLSKFDPQTKISRRHAKIWRDGNSYLVEDLGSSNGTILLPVVNDSKRLAPHQPHVLTNGDKIRLGDTTLHFVIG